MSVFNDIVKLYGFSWVATTENKKLTESVSQQHGVFLLRGHGHRLPGEAEGLENVLVTSGSQPAAGRRHRALHVALVQSEGRRRLCGEREKFPRPGSNLSCYSASLPFF